MAAQIYAMKSVVDKEKIDCDYVLNRFVEVFLDQSQADSKRNIYEGQLAAGLDYIEDLSFIGPKFAERVSASSPI